MRLQITELRELAQIALSFAKIIIIFETTK